MKTFTQADWIQFFPFKEPREAQVDAINFALDTFVNKQKKFCILGLAVGVGKSAVGLTVARYLNFHLPRMNDRFDRGTYVLTTQKVLQDQYVNDFKDDGLESLRSSENYLCKQSKNNVTTCAEVQRLVRNNLKYSATYNSCKFDCVYKEKKKDFLNGFEGVTNYSYFFAETTYSGQLKPRRVIVLDECHRLEEELSKHIELEFMERFATQILGVTPSKPIKTQKQALDWLRDHYKPGVEKLLKQTLADIDANKNLDEIKLLQLVSQQEKLDKHLCKVNRFLGTYSEENWILNVDLDSKKFKKFQFKTIDVSEYSHDYMFNHGERILLMSATVMNKTAFCESVGINENDAEFLAIDSPFPVENRPVFFVPCGKMSLSTIDQTLPNVANAVKQLLDQHKDEKGIIHCCSFKIADFLKKKLKNKRLLFHDSFNREEVLKNHLNSKSPTVLVSPSMSEGVDLHDDLSRFQILCKVPFPYLGCQAVRKRMKKRKHWYAYQTTKTIVQSVGRSVRNAEDHAVTYILDTDFEKFFKTNKNLFPVSFVKSMQS